MQTDNRLLDDLARMANGALNTLSGLRDEIETRVRERVERLLADMDLVTREEFDAVRELAQNARAGQEELATRVAALERRLAEIQSQQEKPRARQATRRRSTTSGETTGSGRTGKASGRSGKAAGRPDESGTAG